MKLEKHLSTFLSDHVNLNQSRIDTLISRVDTITNFIKELDEFRDLFIEAMPQGSWSHKTIIKPVFDSDFDADLVVFLKENEDWEPKDYIDKLYKLFKSNGHYQNITSRRTRCVTLNYAGDFHLDIVPCIRCFSSQNEKTEWILNRKENVMEKTNPIGYTNWLTEKSKLSNGYLKKVIRLTKYLRDHKRTFSAKSILLTTILANRINILTPPFSFSDITVSLVEIYVRLDDYLQKNDEMPVIENPSLHSEDFNRHWDQRKYENFKTCMHRYRSWLEDAVAEQDRDESILKWRKIFGEGFAESIPVNKLAGQSTARSNMANEDLSHVKQIPWYASKPGQITVSANLYGKNKEKFLGSYRSGAVVLKATYLD